MKFDLDALLELDNIKEGILRNDLFPLYAEAEVSALNRDDAFNIEDVSELTKALRNKCGIEDLWKFFSEFIPAYAFNDYRCSINTVTFSDSLEDIGDGAFYNCLFLKQLILPNNLHTIRDDAFNLCVKLKDIKFNNNLKYIGRRAFEDCASLSAITLPKSLHFIDEYAFNESSISEVHYAGTIKQAKTLIQGSNGKAFKGANIQSLHCTDGELTLDY